MITTHVLKITNGPMVVVLSVVFDETRSYQGIA